MSQPSRKSTFGGCTQTSTQTYQGPIPPTIPFTMRLQGTNQYLFYPAGYLVQGATSNTSFDCAPGTLGGAGPGTWSPVLGTGSLIQDLPATGFSLKGSVTVPMNSPEQPSSVVFGGSPAVINVTVTWDIEPGLDTPPELVVQKTSALQNWRPTAGAGGSAGQSVDLTAKLQATGGGSTNVIAAYFTWELTKCSKEPGYAMNAPVANPSNDFDLKLKGDGLILTDANAQKGQTIPGEYTNTTVTVTPYDWGAFGTIKVTAYLPDGSTLVGHLEGDTAQEDIRLPLRSAQSLIADIWKQNNGVTGQADVNDNETDPAGDGHPGDGLSLYEEYRGFIIGGTHVEGNPKKKDYFILNTAGAVTVGVLNMFIQYSLRFWRPIQDMSDKYNILQSAMAASERIFKLLDTPPEIVSPAHPLPGDGSNRIEFRHVWFTYQKLTEEQQSAVRRASESTPADLAAIPNIEWILKDVSFTVEPGQTVAIVGHTGAGKTTITSLMMRFYDVTAGQILLDGVDLRQHDLTELRRHFAVVLQDPFLFTGTLAENIRFGNEAITNEGLHQAAKDVNVLDFIESLPHQFDEPVQERGNSLSTGQKQLINFARALAYNPRILILDEATSSVDTDTELRIRGALERMVEGRTSVLIAHRLSTVQRAETILVLHKAQLREMGTHQQLLAQRGLYYKLYQLQYKDQEDREQGATGPVREPSITPAI